MKRLFLVRHGETEWNRVGRFQGHTDIPLNDEGRAQARALAGRLRGRKIAAVASSDLLRARETAEILAQSLAVPLARIDRDLRERSYGAFEGLTREECAARYPDEWARHVAGQVVEPIGAEPRALVTERVVRSIRRLIDEHGDLEGAMVVVSHGGAMGAFLDRAVVRDNSASSEVLRIANMALFELAWDGERFVFSGASIP